MENSRFYQAPGLDIERIAREMEGMFAVQGYQVQRFGGKDYITIQLKQGGDIESLIGMQAALSLTLHKVAGGIVGVVGQQQWVDKVVTGAIGIFLPPLWPLMVTTGAGVIRQSLLEGQILSALDVVVRKYKPDVNIGPVPVDMAARMQQESGTAAAPRPIQCTNCQEINEEGDRFCSRCGKPLTQQKRTCPQCKAEIKPNAAFCTKCGTTLSH